MAWEAIDMISINYRGKSYFHGDVLEVTARLTVSESVCYNLFTEQ